MCLLCKNRMDPDLPVEKFTAQQLKEARKEFNELRGLLETCQTLSNKIGQGHCDFNAILACLYSIEKNPMYKFLSERDPVLKQVIDVTFLKLRNVGGIIRLSNIHDSEEEIKKMKKDMDIEDFDEKMKELDELVEERKIVEPLTVEKEEDPSKKRKLEEIKEEKEDEKK